jgi:hypothetical protein
MDDMDKLLPCACLSITKHHSLHCPAYYRPAVASALREKDAELAQVKSNNQLYYELEQLKAEVERAHQSANERNVREKALYDECVRLKAEGKK